MWTLIQAGLTMVVNVWESLKQKPGTVPVPEPVKQSEVEKAKSLLKPEKK